VPLRDPSLPAAMARPTFRETRLRVPSVEVADAGLVGRAPGPEGAGQLVVAVRLLLAALFFQAAAEGVVRVVVDRGELENLAELRLGLLVAVDAEVGDSERLADRRLVGLARLRLLEGDGRLRGHALLEVRTALLEEVEGLAHVVMVPLSVNLTRQARPSERRETRPRARSTPVSSLRTPLRTARMERRSSRAAWRAAGGWAKRAAVMCGARAGTPTSSLRSTSAASSAGVALAGTSMLWSSRIARSSRWHSAASRRGFCVR